MPLVLNGGSKKTPKELVPEEKVPKEKTTTSSDFLYPDLVPGVRHETLLTKGLASFALAQRRGILFSGRRRWLLNGSLDKIPLSAGSQRTKTGGKKQRRLPHFLYENAVPR